VFAITGMDRMIPNFASLPEALAQAPAARAGAVQAGRAEPGPLEESRGATLAGTCRPVTPVRDDRRAAGNTRAGHG
jgi:hypothetical protein